jgi:hypothetical protein
MQKTPFSGISRVEVPFPLCYYVFMYEEKILVVTYSGYKAGERPAAFFLNSEEISIIEILDMWLEENFADRQRSRFFIVRCNDGHTYTLSLREKTEEWFLRNRA